MKRLMMLAAAVAASMPLMAETETVGGYTWMYRINDDAAEIYNNSSAAISPKPAGAVTIPSTLGGKTVTSIGDYAFRDCCGLTSVTIPNGVTNIGNQAFEYCSGLTSVKIPPSVTNIGRDAFFCCDNMKEVHISDLSAWCRISFGNGIPYGSNPLEYYTNGLYLNGEPISGDVKLPKDLTHISYCLLAGCSSITSVTIPDGVTSIGDYAFFGCSGLTSVTIPDSVTSVGDEAFYGCSDSLYDTNSIPDVKLKLVDGWAVGNTGSLSGHLDLTGVRGIGNSAFYNCTNLTSVTIPDSVTIIGRGAFRYCSGLTSIIVADGNAHYKSVDGLLLSTDGNVLIVVPGSLTSVTIPDGVTSIGDYAFSGCSGLKEITIPDSVETIWGSTKIGSASWTLDSAFHGCNELERVIIGNGVKEIDDCTFYGLRSLKEVTIGNSVTNIGCSAFYCCDGLEEVAFGEGVTSIGDRAFSNCTNLLSVTIPSSVTNIGDSAFYGCKRLAEVKIESGDIGRYAFGYCDGVSKVTFGDGVTSIGEYSFCNCTNLLSVIVPSIVNNIGNYAFEGCKRLTSVSFLGDEPTCGDSIYGWGSLVTNCVTQAWTGPTDTWQDRPVRVLSGASAAVGGVSMTVPGSWILKHQMLFDIMEGDLTSVLESLAANGRMSVAECYVVGLDPEIATNNFKITSFPLKADGTPDIEHIVFDPPQAKWNVPATYKVKGAANLDGPWQEVGGGGRGATALPGDCCFFKVVVVLP